MGQNDDNEEGIFQYYARRYWLVSFILSLVAFWYMVDMVTNHRWGWAAFSLLVFWVWADNADEGFKRWRRKKEGAK